MDIARECMRAANLAGQGEFKLAVNLYQKILKFRPEYLDAQVGVAGLLLSQGHFHEAQIITQRVVQLYPGTAQAYFLRGLLKEREDLPSAVLLLQEAVKQDPNNATTLFHLARLLFQQAKKNRQRPCLALEVATYAVQVAPTTSTILHLRATICVEMKSLQEATRDFYAALQSSPKHLPSYLGLIDLAFQHDDLFEVRRLLTQAEQRCGHHPSLASRKSNLHSIQGDWLPAIQSAQQLVDSLPHSAKAHTQLSITCIMHGDLKTAKEALNQAIQLDSEDWEPPFVLGQLHKQSGKLSLASQCFQESHQRATHRWQPLNELGLIHLQQKAYSKAIACFSRAIQNNPKREAPYFNLALAHYKSGALDSAETLCAHLQQRVNVSQSTLTVTQQLLQQIEKAEESRECAPPPSLHNVAWLAQSKELPNVEEENFSALPEETQRLGSTAIFHTNT